MSYIDDDLIAEAANEPGTTRIKPWVRWGIVAACLVLLFGTITVAATTDLGAHIFETFIRKPDPKSDYTEYGYVLSTEIERIPVAALTGDIQEVPSRIRWQMENFPLLSSQMPTTFIKRFSSAAEAREYIGLHPLHAVDWDFEEVFTTLTVHGTGDDGAMLHIHLETFYRTDNINIQTFADIYTENWEDEIIYHRAISTENVEYSESFYTTKNQLQCRVITSTTRESGYIGMEGFLVYDGILYWMNVSHLEEDAARAEELLYQWADQFGN